MKRAALLVAMSIAGTLLAGATSARADQSPMHCNSSALNLNVTRDVDTVRDGQNVTFSVTASNDGAGACDVTGATFSIVLPDATGKPNGQTVPIGPSID